MESIKCVVLKPVNGHPIDKTYEVNTVTGKIKSGTTVYTVYDDFDGAFECFNTLKEAQECARNWNN